jgi:hypothetical protein
MPDSALVGEQTVNTGAARATAAAPELSVVMPCLNEADTLAPVSKSVARVA